MELTLQQALQQGIAAHGQGRLKEAEQFYRAILKAVPHHPDANHNLGIIAVSAHQTEAALPLFKTALEQQPSVVKYLRSYVTALIRVQKYEEVRHALQKAKEQGVAREILSQLASDLPKESKNISGGASIPPKTRIEQLLKCYRQGQFAEAEKLAHNLTKSYTEHPLAWKILVALWLQSGRIQEALEAAYKAVKISPEDIECHTSLASALKKLGRLDEAVTSFKQALKLNPNYVEIHYNLGNTLKDLNRLKEAEASFRQAITLKPELVQGHNNLGSVLEKLNRFREAETSFNTAISLKPDYCEAYYNLGRVLRELNKLKEAEIIYQRLIALKPDFQDAQFLLGKILKSMGKLDEAEICFKLVLESHPHDSQTLNSMGNILKEQTRVSEAIAYFEKAIEITPDYADAHCNMGLALVETGDKAQSIRYFEKAIELSPDFAQAHRALSMTIKYREKVPQFLQMESLYKDIQSSEERRCNLGFGLAKASEDLGEFEQAFRYYTEGNALRKSQLDYEIQQDVELFERLKSYYPNIASKALELSEVMTEKIHSNAVHITPIFIVGMPRSGTTLTEQIISSHSKVNGAGELTFASKFGSKIAQGISRSKENEVNNFRLNYLNSLQNCADGALLVTDKMPLNFRYLGLLAAALPEAKFVHVKRDPAAVCWGNFKQYFSSKGLGFSYDLEDMVQYYGLYEDLMGYWSEQLGDRIYHLNYELLTVNQREETIKLLEYLELEWEEACLSPQDNKRTVATASGLQVRKGIYKGSSQQWKSFKPYLNGVLDVFNIES